LNHILLKNCEMRVVVGDIVDCDQRFIIQQCNCVSKSARGLSETLARRFPHGNAYTNRDRDTPGSYRLLHPPPSQPDLPIIICIFGQYRLGRASDDPRVTQVFLLCVASNYHFDDENTRQLSDISCLVV